MINVFRTPVVVVNLQLVVAKNPKCMIFDTMFLIGLTSRLWQWHIDCGSGGKMKDLGNVSGLDEGRDFCTL